MTKEEKFNLFGDNIVDICFNNLNLLSYVLLLESEVFEYEERYNFHSFTHYSHFRFTDKFRRYYNKILIECILPDAVIERHLIDHFMNLFYQNEEIFRYYGITFEFPGGTLVNQDYINSRVTKLTN